MKKASQEKSRGTRARQALDQAARQLEISPEEVPRTVRKLIQETRELEEKTSQLKERT